MGQRFRPAIRPVTVCGVYRNLVDGSRSSRAGCTSSLLVCLEVCLEEGRCITSESMKRYAKVSNCFLASVPALDY